MTGKTIPFYQCLVLISYLLHTFEPRHQISENVVCATIKGSDRPAHMCSLIRVFASRFNTI